MTNTLHYTSEQFNLLLDGRLPEMEAEKMRDHLALCGDCRTAFEMLDRLDAALSNVPVIATEPDFTRHLLDRIMAAPKTSLAFRLLEKMSYVFGLLIVLAIMIAAFVLTGVVNQSQVEQTKSIASGVVDNVGSGVSASIDTFSNLLIQYIPFAFGKGSMAVGFFAVMVVAMLGAIDRVVGRRVLQK